MADFTHGPWIVEGRGDSFAIVTHDDEEATVAVVLYDEQTDVEPLDTEQGKRAQLIAAAPDLLKALEAHVAYEVSVTETIASISGEKFTEAPWLAQARAAIAKARGTA